MGVEEYRRGMVVLKELTQILGLFGEIREKPRADPQDGLTPALLDLFIEIRTQARKDKNFKLSDEIRNRLGALGVVLSDGRPPATAPPWRIEPASGNRLAQRPRR